MNKFQITYIFLFLFSILGLVGNIELGVETPIHGWLLIGITSFFTAGKIVYWIKKGV